MKILPFEQGSPEWVEFRKHVVTASDIPILMMGNQEEVRRLYDLKKGAVQQFVTSSMESGKVQERDAIEWFFGTRKKIERPCVMNENCDWFMASLDALHFPTMTLLEVKTPADMPYQMEEHPLYKKGWWQLQAQLYVTGLNKGNIVLWHPLRPLKKEVERDDQAIMNLLEKGISFYESLKDGKAPPSEWIEPCVHLDEDWIESVKAWKAAKRARMEAEELEKICKEGLVYLANGKNAIGGGARLTMKTRQGAVDYGKIEALKGINLDLYRKPSYTYWEVSEG